MFKKQFSLTLLFLSLAFTPFFHANAHTHHDHKEEKHHNHANKEHHEHHHHEHSHREHGAHQHGVVEFHFAQEKNELLIELIAPGSDVMGFEHQPKTAEQKEKYERASSILTKPNGFLVLNKEANCRLTEKNVEFTADKSEKEHTHGEFHASYTYHCSQPLNLKSVKYQWFDLFPTTEKITIVSLTDKGTKSAEVTAKSAMFNFK